MTDDPHTLSGPYALDALPPDERTAFEAHLARCPSCQDEVRELQATAAQLAAPVATAPPAHLRTAVLDAIEGVRQDRPVVPPDHAPARRTRRPRWLTAVAAALAALAIGQGAALVALSQRVTELDRTTRDLAAVVAAEDAQRVVGTAIGGEVIAVVSRQAGAGVVVARGLEDSPEGHHYALWVIQEGTPVPAGTLPPDGTVEIAFPGGEALGVTVEPEGPLTTPTTEPVMLLEL